jgi:hypothetical protein
MIKILRVSDKRNPINFHGITRNDCIKNFIKVFGSQYTIVLADNCNAETIAFLKELGFTDIRESSLGKTESFKNMLNIVCTELDENEIVYMCEDDFIHMPESVGYINEGLALGNYVSLCDSLDKYVIKGPNPFIDDGKEIVKLMLSLSTHWKFPTTINFVCAVPVKILKEDRPIIEKNIKDKVDIYNASFDIIIERNRQFVTCIPGKATECSNLYSPFIDWEKVIKETI